ncbi:MAG: M23 family metallopeptidase, partial [Alphaproteobacteria bacterium]|nr:M23 family metallopeptidase [Alphaproteobacteria bacterium]
IDYDYDTIDTEVTTETEIPGTIAALPIDTLGETTKAPRTRTESYVVQDNDTISDIARRFGVNVGTILWNNNLGEKSFIRPGDTLKIPPVSGILVTIKSGDTLSSIASKYDGSLEEIKSFNNLGDEKLALGSEIMVPGGRPPEIEQTRAQIASRSEPKSSAAISKLTAPRPVPKPADLDTKDTPKTKLLWPTPGHVITQYYGWKHIGLDIDGDFTSPLYASADGVVETAGWSNVGYGLMVFVNHQNGLKTRYAHASKLFVKAGDTVKRGQVIAMMGTTGKSTGTHIHYEVYVNGKRVNPLSYIK